MTFVRSLTICLIISAACWGNDSSDLKGTLLFEDSFERPALGDRWRVPIQKFSVSDGKLLGHEEPNRGHGAVSRAMLDFQNAILEFSFRFVDGKNFNFVINDKNCKSVHAGHICRVSISPNRIRIADDKEGTMKNEIFAMRQDPKQRAKTAAMIKNRELVVPNRISSDSWHQATVSIVDDEISFAIDGKAIGKLRSSGIAHPTKTDFGFTVQGNAIEFDDVRVWTVNKH